MKLYKNYTLKEYLGVLAQKTPVPGGGSAAALTGALGVALLSMVANYSKGKGKSRLDENRLSQIIDQCEHIRAHLLELVDLDAKAYLKVTKKKFSSAQVRKAALKESHDVPFKVCRLCYKAVAITPFLVEHGNKNLISDVVIAVELLFAAFNSASTLSKYN